jgi:hypothetical protein
MNPTLQQLFNHYRKTGFPYYDDSLLYQIHNLKRFLQQKEQNIKPLFPKNIIGMNLINSAFPQRFHIPIPNALSPIQVFYNDKLLYDFLQRLLNNCTKRNRKISDAEFRSLIKIYPNVKIPFCANPNWTYLIIKNYANPYANLLDLNPNIAGNLLATLKIGANYSAIVQDNTLLDAFHNFIQKFGNPYTQYTLFQKQNQISIGNRYDIIIITITPYQYKLQNNQFNFQNKIQALQYINQQLNFAFNHVKSGGKILCLYPTLRNNPKISKNEFLQLFQQNALRTLDIFYAQKNKKNKKPQTQTFDLAFLLKRKNQY